MTIVLVFRELGLPLVGWSLLPVIVLLFLFDPMYQQLAQGQLNFLLVFLLALSWAADRRDCPGCAGVAVGVAAALKLYPAFVFAYFLLARRWPAILTGGIVFLALDGVALAVLGLDEFKTYVSQVLPSLFNYQSSLGNLSLTGFWLRIFNPEAHEMVLPLVVNPTVAKVLVMLSRVIVAAIVAWVAWRAKSLGERDRAFAAAIVGMILVSPIAWTHYFVLLVLPLALVWQRLPEGPARWVMVFAFLVVWLPDYYLNAIALGTEQARALMNRAAMAPVKPGVNLAAISFPTYALLTLFILVLLTPAESETPGATESESETESEEERLNRRLFGPVGGEAACVEPSRGAPSDFPESSAGNLP